MLRTSLVGLVVLFLSGIAEARGLVIPVEKSIPPLAMVNHRVDVSLVDQVSTTKVSQTFRNHTTRPLEATYVFPVPKGASVTEFAMWVDGQRVKGELVEAAKARQIYTDIVRRTEDPGLLEYMGSDVLRMQIFPVPPQGDQKIEVSFTSIARKDHEIVEYTYPLKTDGKATQTLEDFTLKLTLKSREPVLNIYSPTHAIAVSRSNDREAVVSFEKNQSLLDKDFQLFYTTSGKDVGLTSLMHRPISTEDGTFLLLISPRAELSKEQQVPRDIVFVLDTSGSMREDERIDQAKKALKHCIDGLRDSDRFAILNFATVVNRYRDGLTQVSSEQRTEAKKWVDRLEPSGGTAINDALIAAMDLQTKDEGRTFTVVFFTDGKPTIGETNTDKILANVGKKNTAQTRIFTFGVGHDLNAAFLDQVAEQTRAVSAYVQPKEDMEAKVSSFLGKISHPVLSNLKLAAGNSIRLTEVYPPQLPDLFHGGQIIVLGRYQGNGHAAITLTGSVGKEKREFVYELDFPSKAEDRAFVLDLWARRKVGYLFEQIRLNGEKKELVEELTALAKKHGIATPYTSYLVVPDAAMPVATRRQGQEGERGEASAKLPPGLGGGGAFGSPGARKTVTELARSASGPAPNATDRPAIETAPGGLPGFRSRLEDEKSSGLRPGGKGDGKDATPQPPTQGGEVMALRAAAEKKQTYERALRLLQEGDFRQAQMDKLGVELSLQMKNLKYQSRQQPSALRRVGGRNCLEVGGVWIDEGFNPKMPTVAIKAMSDAYFRLLEKYPQVKEVLELGNHLVWVTPSGVALVIDTTDGKEKLTDAEIDKLFATK